MINTFASGMLAMMLTKFMMNDVPHAAGIYQSLEEKYRLIKRTKRGSRIVIQREGNLAKVELLNNEDAMQLSMLLNAAGIRYKSESGVRKDAWEGTPAHLREKRGVMSVKHGTYPGRTVTFDFGELERIMKDNMLMPTMIE